MIKIPEPSLRNRVIYHLVVGSPLLYREIGSIFGLSGARIRQIALRVASYHVQQERKTK
jgi:hypothetical protein